MRFDGYPVVFNTRKTFLTALIASSSLYNLKSNNYNKNDKRRKATTPIQYSTRTSGMAMLMMTTITATMMTRSMTTTSTLGGLG